MEHTKPAGRILGLYLVIVLLAINFPAAAQAQNDNQMVAELINQVDIEAITRTIARMQDDQDPDSPDLDDDGTRFTPSLNATDNVRDIRDQFEAYELVTDIDTFFPTAEDCDSITNGMDVVCPPVNAFQNVIATLKGRDSSKYFLVMAHYDSINPSGEGWYANKDTIPAPGANDNASGVAVMIETARVLSNSTFHYDIRFLALAAEEWGFLGSRRYVSQAIKNNEQIVGFINMDMVGISDTDRPNIYVYYKLDLPESETIAQSIITANDAYDIMRAAALAETDLEKGLSGRSDQVPFWNEGIPGVYFGASANVDEFNIIDPTYHTEDDVLYKPDGTLRLSADQLESLTQLTVASVASIIEVNPALQPWSPTEPGFFLPFLPDFQELFREWFQNAQLWFTEQVDLLWQQAEGWLLSQWNHLIELLERELIRFFDETWQGLVEQCMGSVTMLLVPAMIIWGKARSLRKRE